MADPPPPSPPPPPLKGVVIISLPPPDDPSQGKTITAFTIPVAAGTAVFPAASQQLAVRRPPPPSLRLRGSVLKKAAIGLVCASAALVLLWACVSSETTFDFLADPEEEERGREVRSFLFPLYRKAEIRGRRGRWLREAGVDAGAGLRGTSKVGAVKSSGVVNSSALFPLRGNISPDGLYFTVIEVGSPPRPYFLDVDTGSDLTWIQCDAPCTRCAKGPHPLYKPTREKIVSPMDPFCLEIQSKQNDGHCKTCQQCDYGIEYADYSSSLGVLAKDELQLQSMSNDIVKPNFVFGCAYDQQGQLLVSPAKTDGLLGLSNAKLGLPSQLAGQNIISNVVGHCISGKESGDGYMFLGDEFIPRWGVTWAPMFRSHVDFYQAEALKINYGEEQLGPNRNRVIFDTGSTYSYFTNAVYSDLINSLKDGISTLVRDESDLTFPLCWQAAMPIRSVEEVKQFFKPLILHFGSSWLFMPKLFKVPPENYLTLSEKGNICLGILNGTEVHEGTANILGDISLRGQLVVYDNEQQKIGWVKSDCVKPQKMNGFPFFF